AFVDRAVLPRSAGLAGIARPPEALGMPAGADDIDVAIAIHVQREVAQRCEVGAVFLEAARVVALPGRIFIPGLAGEDVGAAVVVEVGDGARLADAGVDSVALERDLRAARRDAQDRGQCSAGHRPVYSHTSHIVTASASPAAGSRVGMNSWPT